MLIMGYPQFETQDDLGIGDGIPPVPEWQLDSTTIDDNSPELSSVVTDHAVRNVFIRLRILFQRVQRIPFTPFWLHDLASFVVHRLLLSALDTGKSQSTPITECIRYAIILYMFITQGPTYYSHGVVLNTLVTRFIEHLKQLELTPRVHDSLDIWLLAVGMVASFDTSHYDVLVKRAQNIAAHLLLDNWNDALIYIKSVLWLETEEGEGIFRPHWDRILGAANAEPPGFTLCVSSKICLSSEEQ
jgi:hypothetical protein